MTIAGEIDKPRAEPMSLLQVAYLIDAIVTAPIALSMLIGSGSWVARLTGEAMPGNADVRTLLGSLWGGLLVCLVVGIFFPVAMLPVLLLQLVYKGLWLLTFAIPRWASGRFADVPLRLSGLFAGYVLVYPWVIPWEFFWNLGG